MDAAAWSYLRCSFLFLVALVVTWVWYLLRPALCPPSPNWELPELIGVWQIPSSINRIYALKYPDATNFGLNFVGCLVLPLQGFWNAIIYISTSLPVCKELWLLYVFSRLRWNKISGEVQNIPLYERRCNVRFNTVSIVSLAKYASERASILKELDGAAIKIYTARKYTIS